VFLERFLAYARKRGENIPLDSRVVDCQVV
jgi:hypothetical protein